MNKEQLVSALTFTKRVGGLVIGFDPVKSAMQLGEAEVVLLASDLSPKTHKEVLFLCDALEVPYRETPLTLDELWYLIGKRAGILAVVNPGFAEKLTAIIDTE